MFSLLSFQRQLRPGPYALSSLGVFFSQHAIACLVLAAHGRPLASFVLDRLFLFMPLQMLARQGGLPNVVLIGSFLIVLLAYGFGIFVVSPFIIGATTGYFAN